MYRFILIYYYIITGSCRFQSLIGLLQTHMYKMARTCYIEILQFIFSYKFSKMLTLHAHVYRSL
ncbi:hypothetical protein ACJX0J_035851 [Zea mays]